MGGGQQGYGECQGEPMTRFYRRVFRFVAMFHALAAVGHAQEASPRALVDFLTYRSDRPGRSAVLAGIGGCGHMQEDRAAATALAAIGTSAVPSIEEALTDIERRGAQSEFSLGAAWLLDSYARIKGTSGFPRLRSMIGVPRLDFLQVGLSGAVSISLGITSYVSSSSPPGAYLSCNRPLEPRHALSQLVLAWENDDLPSIEASLGPDSLAALESLLRDRPWPGLREEIWPRKGDRTVSVGYQFQVPGPWSQADETLDRLGSQGGALASPSNTGIETRFTTGSGANCGELRIQFQQNPRGGRLASLPYVVNNSEIYPLLQLISSCAARVD